MQDIFHWRAYLDVGAAETLCVDEYDSEYPTGRGFALLPQDAVVGLELIPQQDGLRHVAAQLPRYVGMQPVFFRKRFIQFDPVTGEALGQSTIHCLGWTLAEAGVASYCFVFEDGSTLLSENENAV